MWVLINENGQVITQIPHGQIVRQGSTFHVYVAFEKNYFRKFIGREIAIYSIERLKTWVNDHIEATFSFDGTFDTYPSNSERMFFERLTDNENLCSFKDKEWYLVFKYNGTPSQSDEYGAFNLNLRLSKIERDSNSKIISHDVEVIGPMSIYIEKTYGKKTNNNTVTREQIDELLDLINTKAKNNVIHYISDIMFESYHELAQYCLDELVLKEENRLIYADVLNNMTIATVNNQTRRVMMISADGNILCSNGNKYYYVSMSDAKILNSLMIGEDVQLLINNGNLIIQGLEGSSTIDLNGISKGILVGQPFLESFALEKQKEAMPYLGVDPPTQLNNELNQLWFQVADGEEVETINQPYMVRQTPQEIPIIKQEEQDLLVEGNEILYMNEPVKDYQEESLIQETNDILIEEPIGDLIFEEQEQLVVDSSEEILLE